MKEELPLVSIVTPSYNKGEFIEETILSIKNQIYPRIEHIIIDAGSTDDTIDIIKEYEGTYNMQWISEPDEGQSDAINKGWRMSKGEILAYLNADDTYMPEAVETAVKYLTEHQDVSMVYGDCNLINEYSEVIGKYAAREFNLEDMLCWENMVPQQTVFLRREVLEEVGYIDANLYMAMDYDLWVRIGLTLRIQYIPQLLANLRHYPEMKSVSEAYKIAPDHLYVLDKIFSSPQLPPQLKSLKNRAYCLIYLRMALNYRRQAQIKKALCYLIKSVILYPRILKSSGWIMIEILVGSRVLMIASRWKSRLRSVRLFKFIIGKGVNFRR